MSSFFGRVLQYLVNEVAVKKLANNHTFQQFAVRTHQNVQKLKDVASTGAEGFGKASEGIREFSQALKEEVKKDISKFNKGNR